MKHCKNLFWNYKNLVSSYQLILENVVNTDRYVGTYANIGYGNTTDRLKHFDAHAKALRRLYVSNRTLIREIKTYEYKKPPGLTSQ